VRQHTERHAEVVSARDLEPGAAPPPHLVLAVQPLRDHALQPVLTAGAKHDVTVADLVGRRVAVPAAEVEVFQPVPSGDVRVIDQELAVEVEQIKDHVVDRRPGHHPRDVRLGGQAHALLELFEARPTPLVEGDDLPVEHRLVGAPRPAERRELRVAPGDVVAVTGLGAEPTAVPEGDRPNAVPLELEAVALLGSRASGAGGWSPSHPVPRDAAALPSPTMAAYHVLAAIGDTADDHRSLGVFEAGSAAEALGRCLADQEREPDLHGAPLDLIDAAREEHERIRRQLAEPDACFIVVPVSAESHFVRDHAGVVRDAGARA
jgi:hypothetical protein